MRTDLWNYPEGTTTPLDIQGFKVRATDGEIGKIDEATYDVGSAFIVVDTGPHPRPEGTIRPGWPSGSTSIDVRLRFGYEGPDQERARARRGDRVGHVSRAGRDLLQHLQLGPTFHRNEAGIRPRLFRLGASHRRPLGQLLLRRRERIDGERQVLARVRRRDLRADPRLPWGPPGRRTRSRRRPSRASPPPSVPPAPRRRGITGTIGCSPGSTSSPAVSIWDRKNRVLSSSRSRSSVEAVELDRLQRSAHHRGRDRVREE